MSGAATRELTPPHDSLVLPYNRALCAKWAEVTVAAQSRGCRIECADAWIAATALHYDVPLVTHNRND